MKPVDQTSFGKPHGNCLQACIASVLELELDDVPNFMERRGDLWQEAVKDFLARFDLDFIDIAVQSEVYVPSGFHLIAGESQRGLFHSVVGLNGRLVHDPHPSRAGLQTEEFWTLFVARLLKPESVSERTVRRYLSQVQDKEVE